MIASNPPRSVRRDSLGGGGHFHHNHHVDGTDEEDDDVQVRQYDKFEHIASLQYHPDQSAVYRASKSAAHYRNRSETTEKHAAFVDYMVTSGIGVFQAIIAYGVNLSGTTLIDAKFRAANSLLEQGEFGAAYARFMITQLVYASLAAILVCAVEPLAAGSGIPEVKCYLNGIDLPRVGDLKTLVTKVVGVVFSVAAGLPVGKEGPMVHSGAIVAKTLSREAVRNDRHSRDFVASGAAAGVCTAFSAPIGGILFALEEGASYWAPSLTWRTFFCSMVALTSLLVLNSIGSSALGKVGFNHLFSFGNFVYEGSSTSYYLYELFLFVAIGVVGGLIGAVFNNTNEKLTKWRIRNINHSPVRRFIEVCCLSVIVSTITFVIPLLWNECTPLPVESSADSGAEPWTQEQKNLMEELVSFGCDSETEYNQLASLYFTEPGVAIRQLFHLHLHAFSDNALLLFFIPYISMAVVVYGIAVPSGLFVPSLLSGAALGRLMGNLANRLYPNLAYSNTYALMGAAAVLGGMARMTISLTVILLECTGNEQFVLPLMLTLMTARLTGGLFNHDLYHIHIHFKPGVLFLEPELPAISRHHDLLAHQIMGDEVVFARPVEKVGVIIDILQKTNISRLPVVDTHDDNVLVGTIGRNELCVLLQKRAFGIPTVMKQNSNGGGDHPPAASVMYHDHRYVPLVDWSVLEGSFPRYPTADEIVLSASDRECYLDLRPYMNTAPITVQEDASVLRTYEIFRTLGMRFLPVVNRHNQVVGTITRTDLTPDALAHTILARGKKSK